MSFDWIFAMIVGGAILFIAIYGAVKLIEGGTNIIYTEAAEQLKSLLDPFETGLSSGEASEMHFSRKSKIFLEDCDYSENKPFGRQTIAFSEKSLSEKEDDKGEPISVKNKYIFAEKIVEGKDMYVFSKPFFMGFKVADLIVIESKDYCFYQTPEEIKSEIEGLQIKNINFSDDMESCNGIVVCFDVSNPKCNIKVYGECEENCESVYDYGKVVKYENEEISEMSYIGNLVFSAIFSSPEIYECNVRRLMSKFNELGKVYINKIKIIEMKECSSNIEGKLSSTMSSAKQIDSSEEIKNLYSDIKEIETINGATTEGCRLFEGGGMF